METTTVQDKFDKHKYGTLMQIYRSGKGEPWHWRPFPIRHLQVISIEQQDFDSAGHIIKPTQEDKIDRLYEFTGFFKQQHMLVTTRLQVFWLWFVIEFNLIAKEQNKVETHMKFRRLQQDQIKITNNSTST
jgi:hypothetical protein